MSFGSRVVAAWYTPRLTAAAALLYPFSLLFRAVVAIRRALYRMGALRTFRLAVPVVVVGNITVGGSGKTPLVIALAEALAARGMRPGLVSRGYGGSADGSRSVTPGDDAAVVGDEPLILAASGFPVWIGRDRARAAGALLEGHPSCDVILCDDGLQHYRLARTMEIAVVDQARGAGNGFMLPAGPLREPESRLSEVDAVVHLVSGDVSRASDGDARVTFMTLVPAAWRSVRDRESGGDPTAWHGPGVHAVAGIGHPQRFFALLRAQGIAAVEHPFPDHHPFVAADFAFADAMAILMTEKDAVKCAGFADERFFYLPVRAALDPALVAFVEDKVRGSQAH